MTGKDEPKQETPADLRRIPAATSGALRILATIRDELRAAVPRVAPAYALELRMNVSSDVTWMNAARSGFRNLSAAIRIPRPSTAIVPTKFCITMAFVRRATRTVSTNSDGRFEQHDVGALAGHIRTRPHRDAYRRPGQRWRIVRAITDHRDNLAGVDELAHVRALLFGSYSKRQPTLRTCPTAVAARRTSPVSKTVRIDMALRAATAEAASGRSASAIANRTGTPPHVRWHRALRAALPLIQGFNRLASHAGIIRLPARYVSVLLVIALPGIPFRVTTVSQRVLALR
jgi:hypothetical protein